MAPYEILLSLFSSTAFTSIVNLMVRTIIDQIITKKIAMYKNGKKN